MRHQRRALFCFCIIIINVSHPRSHPSCIPRWLFVNSPPNYLISIHTSLPPSLPLQANRPHHGVPNLSQSEAGDIRARRLWRNPHVQCLDAGVTEWAAAAAAAAASAWESSSRTTTPWLVIIGCWSWVLLAFPFCHGAFESNGGAPRQSQRHSPISKANPTTVTAVINKSQKGVWVSKNKSRHA